MLGTLDRVSDGTITAAPSEQAVLDRVPKELFIGGRWRAASGGGTLPVEDPATGEPLVEVADAQEQDALDGARRRRGRAGGVGRAPAARARRDPAPGLRGDRRAGATNSRC